MGHPNNRVLKETEKFNIIQIRGVHHRPCEHCAQAKIRMKNIPKEAEQIATRKGERHFLDITWVKTASFADNHF
jgi:hypothetical protein